MTENKIIKSLERKISYIYISNYFGPLTMEQSYIRCCLKLAHHDGSAMRVRTCLKVSEHEQLFLCTSYASTKLLHKKAVYSKTQNLLTS